LACFSRTEFEWFHVYAIDIDGYGLLDQIDTDDETVLLLPRDEDTFCSNEYAALDPYPHAFCQVGMWIIGETLLNHRTHCGDLLIGHWHWFATDTHNACYTNSFQHCDAVLQSKIAKEVTPEQWNLNDLYTVLPDTALMPQRKQMRDALCDELVADHLLVP
jgi:hypothetical protein